MCSRCSDPSKTTYYGKVSVHPSWRGREGYATFLNDMGPRPSEGHTIDRLGLHYGPGSCRWATVPEQNRNKSNNRLITVGNRTMPVCDWAAATGIKETTLSMRLGAYGWDPVRALSAKIKNGGNRTNHPGRRGRSCRRPSRATRQEPAHVGVAA